jgi:hypothetical protein
LCSSFVCFAFYFVCSTFLYCFVYFSPQIYCCYLLFCVQFYRSLPLGANPIAVNKYHIHTSYMFRLFTESIILTRKEVHTVHKLPYIICEFKLVVKSFTSQIALCTILLLIFLYLKCWIFCLILHQLKLNKFHKIYKLFLNSYLYYNFH